MKNWEEQFDKEFLDEYLNKPAIKNKPKEIKLFISNLLKELRDECVGEPDENAIKLRVSSEFEAWNEARGYNIKRQQIIDIFNKLI